MSDTQASKRERLYERPGYAFDLVLSAISIVVIVFLVLGVLWVIAQIVDGLGSILLVALGVLAVIGFGAWVWSSIFPKVPHKRSRTRGFRLAAKEEYGEAKQAYEEEARKGKPSKKPGFFRIQIGHVIWRQFRHAFAGRKLRPYLSNDPKFSVYDLGPEDESIRVGMTGDFGSGIPLAGQVAEAMKRFGGEEGPHLTIHLGDIYHTGSVREAKRNFAPPPNASKGVRWPHGSRGALAVPGNHEYDSGGDGYYDVVLDTLGVADRAEPTKKTGQAASFFCLKNDHWLIVGLDTGFWATRPGPVRLFIGLLQIIPLLKSRSFVKRLRTRLPNTICAWLQDVVRPLANDDKKRGLIFLSHHQFITAFDKRGPYVRPGEQIAKALELESVRSVLWFQAHEHRLVTYECQLNDDAPSAANLEVYARAIGNGGALPDPIPDLTKSEKLMESRLVRYIDNRVAADLQPQLVFGRRRVPLVQPKVFPVGFHGYANLTFHRDTLTVEYRSLGSKEMVKTFLRGEENRGDKTIDELLLKETFEIRKGNLVCTDEWSPLEPLKLPNTYGFLAPFGPPDLVLPKALAAEPPSSA